MLKGQKTLFGAFGAENTPISLCFRFLLHFYAEIGSKLHFFSEETPDFSKQAPSAAKFWALRAQNFAPPTHIDRGAETLDLAVLGELATPRYP